MAEERQPATVQEGMDAPEPPATDRAEAKALSTLDAKPDDDAGPKKDLDMKALNAAMQNLGGSGGEEKKAAEASTVPTSKKKTEAAEATRKRAEEEARRKAVRVDAGDVGVVVSLCFLSSSSAHWARERGGGRG